MVTIKIEAGGLTLARVEIPDSVALSNPRSANSVGFASNALRSSYAESRQTKSGGGDPSLTGSGDPSLTGSLTNSGDPSLTGSGDPSLTGSGDPSPTYGRRGGAIPASRRFVVEPQQQPEWCWAAVAVSVEKYFNPASPLRQCDVATSVVGGDPCREPVPADKPEALDVALRKINRLKKSVSRPLSFNELRQEIDANRPLCAGIRWRSGGGHFVILSEYEIAPSGARHVHVEDPLNPSGTLNFDEFTNFYYGDGEWVESYLVQNLQWIRRIPKWV
jgi:hypothetical protein